MKLETKQLLEMLRERYTYDDGVLLSKRTGKAVGTPSTQGYLSTSTTIDCQYVSFRIHRAVFLMHHGYLPDIVDHIDGNILNNKIENLRECTLQQNSFNRSAASRNKLGVKGVVFDSRIKRYVVYMKINGKSTRVGGYKTIEEAADAYRIKAEETHGSYALHNR